MQIPSWVSSLHNLVQLELLLCVELQQLTCLGNLHRLEELRLGHMPNLEHITEKSCAPVCKSLKRVLFSTLPKLKGWVVDAHQLVGKSSMDMANLQLLCLPQLKTLEIYDCRELSFFPFCPIVERLDLSCFNDELRV